MSDENTTNQGVSEGAAPGPALENTPLSFGEKAVGLTFNPSNDESVQAIKQAFANVIDILHNQRMVAKDGDVARMLSVAITEAQSAQMWGVKAVTWKY